MEKITTQGPKETQQLAAKLAAEILEKKFGKTAVVLGLWGDLGAGKTTFLQGLAAGLGILDVVNSPTFVIMKRFELAGKNFQNFYHFDLYRLNSPAEILELGFKEIISNPKNIVAIEWPEKISKILPKNIIKIQFEHLKENQRGIKMLR